MVFVLTEQNTVANQFLLELRDRDIQQDRLRFRTNLERLGAVMAYEISKQMAYRTRRVETTLATSTITVLQEQPVLLTILRAGLPFYSGFQHFFDRSDAGFIGAFRNENTMSINLDYIATPHIGGKQVILIDPMLATGRSIAEAVKAITKNGIPQHLFIASLVAAPEGIENLKRVISIPFSIYTVALDERLNQKNYIVPGLGDAGDLSFGEKEE
ncbi:MAG: uracil phosphoribosyltransferase [Bacteroidota bacterium]